MNDSFDENSISINDWYGHQNQIQGISEIEAFIKNFPMTSGFNEVDSYRDYKIKILKKKRGRKCTKTKKGNNKVHSSDDFDNILRKIQVHFLSFVNSFPNDVIKNFSEEKKHLLYKFNYSDKRNIKHENVESFKTMTIKELFLKIRPSPKYNISKTKENINESIINILTNYSWFNEYLNKTFSDVFKLYYNEKMPLEYITVEGKIIELSQAKNFYYLLQKNKKDENKLIEIAENVYLKKKIRFYKIVYNNDDSTLSS